MRLLLVALVAALLSGLWLGGVFEWLSDPENVRAAIAGLGAWGPLLYVLAFSLLEPFFVPGIAFVLPGALVWDFPTLFVLSWLGSVGAGVVGFSFARYLGRDYVVRHLPERLHRYDEQLARSGLRSVIVVRLTLFLAPPAHWLLGLSRVGFGAFLLGTMIGFLPGIALLTYVVVFVGGTLMEWLVSQPREVWLVLALLALALAAARRAMQRRADARAAAQAPSGGGGD